MREELSGIAAAIEQRSLPETAEQFFGRMWDVQDQAFVGQEKRLEIRRLGDFADQVGKTRLLAPRAELASGDIAYMPDPAGLRKETEAANAA